MICSTSAITILLVEDDEDTIEIAGTILALRFPEFTFHFATNGREGIDRFREHPADIIITDIDMPVMDGIQMAVEIKGIKADTKIIVLTGHSYKKRFEKFSEIGVNEFIMKPVMFDKLFGAIERCIVQLNS
jgi:YesN/AraC family two-component response regulator